MANNPKQFNSRQKTKRTLRTVFILSTFLAIIIIDHLGWIPSRQQHNPQTPAADYQRYNNKQFKVINVVDGDTIDIDIPDRDKQTTRIRFWAINTPEIAKTDKPAQPFADDATLFTQKACLDKTVTLHLEPHSTRGKFGRLLAFIELPDKSILNENLVKAGLAHYEDRFSHSQLKKYQQLEQTARKNNHGIWKK